MDMKIEIWSDIVCPWCYIGKRRLERVLEDFEHSDKLEIEYKSFQLDPYMETDTSVNIYQYLSDKKGMSIEDAKEMGETVSGVAQELGLNYNLSQTIPINTLKAHELLHFALERGLQKETKEALLKAYFIDGKNLSDFNEIASVGEQVGLNMAEILNSLESGQYSKAVQEDIQTGQSLGLRGVPFFVLNRKYGISGAQSEEVFLDTINKAYEDWNLENQKNNLKVVDGDSCEIGGNC